MARAAYTDTIASIAADGTLKAIGNVKVEVRKVSDDTLVNLFSQRSGGSTIGTSLTTGPSGLVEFFAESGEYKITYTDLTAPARITSPRTFGWDAVSGSQSPEETGFQLGDLKLSSLSNDHGRWLKMNGRELTQAEIESALSLGSGDAAAFVSYMGTGGSSRYGAAASSKVKLPDTRRRALVGAGPTGDTTPTPPTGTTARALGAAGGAETVTLAANQSGVPAHSHGVTDSGHSHTSPGHTHTQDSHQHGFLGQTGEENEPHTHPVDTLTQIVTGLAGGGSRNGLVNAAGGIGTIARAPTAGHTHNYGGVTNLVTATNNNTAVTINNAATGLTVNNASATAAAASHENMPPFVTVGYLFIRV